MKVYIRGKLDGPKTFKVEAFEEDGKIILDDILKLRGIKATVLDAEFEVLYELLSPGNNYKIYEVYSTNYPYIPDWIKKGKGGLGSSITPFEIEVINHQLKKYKAKVIYEKN